jgi:hypothetical protein
MTNPELLKKLALGACRDVAFEDLKRLAVGLGFQLINVSGDHHVFLHPKIQAPICLQLVGNAAAPHQVRQFTRLVERFGLRLEGELP